MQRQSASTHYITMSSIPRFPTCELMEQPNYDDCRQFLRFRAALIASRHSWDDRIMQRLNNTNPRTPAECKSFRDTLKRIHDGRISSIRRCIDFLSAEPVGSPINTKELGLFESELVVEEIVQAQSWEAVDRQCPPHRLFTE